jgi:7-cyano-7-deazaguanine synthase
MPRSDAGQPAPPAGLRAHHPAMTDPRHALVLFSGGQDSTVCLAWALEHYAHVETVGFDDGQRPRVELDCRSRVRRELQQSFPAWGPRLGPDHVLDLSSLGQLASVAPSERRGREMKSGGLANEFIPGRNLLFFGFAATVADRRGLSVLVSGMCERDFSSYPDARDNTLKALQIAISLGLDTPMTIETPLMWRDKTQIWALAEKLGGESLIDLVVEHTSSCYMGDRAELHGWGYGCGLCPSCDLRRKGYQAWVVS